MACGSPVLGSEIDDSSVFKNVNGNAEILFWINVLWSRGSPAHAGIGPVSGIAGAIYRRFPRACGDRPQTKQEPREQDEVPPRMRG